jgi:predicted phage tail protein
MKLFIRSWMRTSKRNRAAPKLIGQSERPAGPEILLQIILGAAMITLGGFCYFMGNTYEGMAIAAIGVLSLYVI